MPRNLWILIRRWIGLFLYVIIILTNKQLIDCIQNTVDKSIDLWFDQARLILKMSSQAEKKRADEELYKINSEIVNAQLNQVKDKINQV